MVLIRVIRSYEYFNRNFAGQEYDPIKRRSKSKGAKAAGRGVPMAAAPGRNVTKGGKENARIESRARTGATAARTRTKRGESAVPSVPAELLEKSEQQVQELGVVVRDLEKVGLLHDVIIKFVHLLIFFVQER